MERALMRLQTLRVDTHRQLSEHFKVKVQLKEQIEDNECKLHFCRGVVAALDELEKILLEEISPGSVPARVPTSPGFVHSGFEGQAMDKPKDKIEFPDAPDLSELSQTEHPEFGEPQRYKHSSVQEVQ